MKPYVIRNVCACYYVTIQSSKKTLTDEDLDRINQLIISTVESKTGAKIRS